MYWYTYMYIHIYQHALSGQNKQCVFNVEILKTELTVTQLMHRVSGIHALKFVINYSDVSNL